MVDENSIDTAFTVKIMKENEQDIYWMYRRDFKLAFGLMEKTS